MWLLYAVTASLCWGMSYAASGPILRKGLSPVLFFFGYSTLGFLGSLVLLSVTGKIGQAFRMEGVERGDLGWFLFSIGGSAFGAFLTYAAMSAKNPTIVSLIEISYPLFVVIFAWLFFREMQLNPMTICGGLLVIAGVTVIIFGER